MRYYLRRVDYADRDFLFRLKAVCLKEYVAAIWGWDDAEQRRRFEANFDPAASQIVVVCGRDVGQYSVQVAAEELFLSQIYLLPAYQNQGLGSLIVNDLLADARQREKPVGLQVLVGNPARNLYERLGFRVVGETETHVIMRNG